MNDEVFQLPGDFDGEVRLFPLPKLVFFPQNVQPLHVFESRYREMVEDAIRGDQLIAIATLMPGYESDYYSRPAVSRHICIGRVASHEKTDDGKYNLILVGVKRAEIESEVTPVKSYRRANTRVINERLPDADDTTVAALGRDLAKCLAASMPAAKELVEDFLDGKLSLGTLTDIIAFHFPFSVDFKLQLLSESDAVIRARLLRQKLPRQTQSKSADSSAPRFSDN
jgi:ATP-dependent Lon protease